MKPTDILYMSLQNVLRGGRKSLLSVVAIAVGIFSVCMISGMGEVVAGEVREKVNETGISGITIYPSSGNYSISEKEVKYIAETSGVKAVSPFIFKSGSVVKSNENHSAAFVGVNDNIQDVFNMTLLHGSYFTQKNISASEKVAIIDDKLAEELYERSNIIGKDLTFTVQSAKAKFKVIGVIKSQKQGLESMMGAKLPNIIYIPHTVLKEMVGNSQNDKIAVSCIAGMNEKDIADNITRELSFDNNITFEYENINEYISGLWEIVDIIKLFIKAVASISLVVGGIGIMNSMLFTVDARKSDIGVCMALGETRQSISLRFLSEAVILCLLGGSIGILLTLTATLAIEQIINISVTIPTSVFIKCIALSAICGCICGIVPANRAAKLNPIDIIAR